MHLLSNILSRRKLETDIASLGQHATSTQKSKVIERSTTLRRRISAWVDVQSLYIPGTALLRSQIDDTSTIVSEMHAHRIQLWLPSEIGRLTACSPNLQSFEWRLREAQADDSLKDLRSSLRLHSFLTKKKKDWSRGVRQNTRSATAINQAMSRVNAHAMRYRAAWNALTALAPLVPDIPEAWSNVYRELKPEDVRGLPKEGLETGEGHITLSWIWLSFGSASSPQNQAGLTDGTQISHPSHFSCISDTSAALRIQWLRTRARAMRWDEEVKLLLEEMRRVKAFFHWQGDWWASQQSLRARSPDDPTPDDDPLSKVDEPTIEGLAAYARRQAELRYALRDHCTYMWRYVDGWLESGEVPEGRNWLSDVVQPEYSPANIFNRH